MPGPDPNAKLLADIDTKTAEIKAAIHDANGLLKDLRAERKELRAHLAWAAEQHEMLLSDMVERSSAEVLRATGAVMDSVARQLTDIVQRTQSVGTLARVDRLLHYVETQLTDEEPAE
jgi:F0F1-type ATP synthase membrane subunit b/b'